MKPVLAIKLVAIIVRSLSSTAHGFAYAPNFITKIIEQTTGLTPIGLLDVNRDRSANGHPVNGDADLSKCHTTTDSFKGPITTRFPPEPNGYLHLGHAKAICFNFAVARAFASGGGRCHMRLDDTNPSKEEEEYVQSILEDVRWIQQGMAPFENAPQQQGENRGPWYGNVRKTSDYFQLIYDAAVHFIRTGDAFVDELSAEEIRDYRGTLTEPGRDSPWRNRSIEENLSLFEKMKEGEFPEGSYVLRAKIDMTSPNVNMRDPVIYRIKHESHQATGDKWCIYPMYDFSHPIADAVEGITHSLCTLEFEDHRPLYDWVAEKILKAGLVSCQPQQIEFSRLNLKYTVLSKRKLIKLIEENVVNGWDDPRMPTLSGIRRRGVPPSAIRLFCERMGISKADSNIDFTILEDCAREVLDEESPRAFAILNPLKVTIQNWEESIFEEFQVSRHPKRHELGDRCIPMGKNLFIERSDFFDLEGPEGLENGGKCPKGFKRLLPKGKVRLKYAYVVRCEEVVRDPTTNEPLELLCSYFPETRSGVTPEGEARVGGIIQWVEASTAVKCKVMQYDRLFKTEEPGHESGNFIDDINTESLKVIDTAIVEPSVATNAYEILATTHECSKSNTLDGGKLYHSALSYQFERCGYFTLDSSSTEKSLVFNRIVTLKDTWTSEGKAHQQHNPVNKQKESDTNLVDDIRRVALRVGTIVEVGPHPEADSLIVCKLDCGDKNDSGDLVEPRTVVAGLAGKIPFEKLVNRKVVCVSNLKPAKMRGIESTAMLLAASNGNDDNEIVELLDVPASVPNGELIYFENVEPGEPDVMLKSKGALKVWDRLKAHLIVNKHGEATYQDDGVFRKLMTSAGPITVNTLKNCLIG